MRAIDRLLKWLEIPINAMLWVGIAAGLLMMLHVTADVTGRTVFSRPLAGTTEIVSGWYMVAGAYLPWAWIARNDGHIVVDLFARLIPSSAMDMIELGVKLLTWAWVTLFAYQTYLRAVQTTRAGEVWEAAGGFILIWPSRWLLPLAAGSMSLYLLLRIVSDVGHMFGRRA